MEHTPLSPGRSPELPSVSPPSGEIESSLSGAEIKVGNPIEKEGQHSSSVPTNDQTRVAASIAVPAVGAPVFSSDDAVQVPISLPTVANDDDLIEKEWVEKAKKVLAETREDPYLREQEVGRLQADYLMKRYGRELGSPSER